jgi:hypothetical protein
VRGIQFVVDDTGKKRAVLIDLSEWGELWEDIYDVMISRLRKDEPSVSWQGLKAEIHQEDLEKRRQELYKRLEAEELITVPQTPPEYIRRNMAIDVKDKPLSQMIIEERR